jgi:membrane protein implicated in regulation of membrane protease activity
MSDMTCPHCHSHVPRGALVCTGCKAEIEYGAPGRIMMVIALVAAVIAGFLLSQILPFLPWWSVGLAGMIAFFGAAYLTGKYFGNRIVFYRHYRHSRNGSGRGRATRSTRR